MRGDEPDRSAGRAQIEFLARDAYGKILAIVARSTRDLHAAEDAVADALAKALVVWPDRGAPANPEAWLVTVARRRLIDAGRSGARRVLMDSLDRLPSQQNSAPAFPDERLGLLFACAHPAIDASARTALMLRAVMGLEIERIASALLVSPASLKQRLTRAKAKIRDSGIRLSPPEREDLAERLDGVLTALYAALSCGIDPTDSQVETGDLSDEAIHLAGVVSQLTPDEPEPMGLLALGLYCRSRRTARQAYGGRFVPLDEQDIGCWDHAMIDRAEQALNTAARFARPGRFQIEAALQSAHVDRLRSGVRNWPVIVGLYDLLLKSAPSIGAAVGRAAAIAESGDPLGAIRELDAVAVAYPSRLAACQFYWAVRGDCLLRIDRAEEAYAALTTAIGLTTNPGVREYLIDKRPRGSLT